VTIQGASNAQSGARRARGLTRVETRSLSSTTERYRAVSGQTRPHSHRQSRAGGRGIASLTRCMSLPLGGEAFVDIWKPKVGERAARLQWTSTRLLALGGLLVPISGLLLGIGISQDSAVLLALGAATAVCCVVAILMGWVLLLRTAQALSDFFGFKVTVFGAPTFQPDAFARWCRKHGVGPEDAPGGTDL
jgi:hypothetical protein